MQPEVSGLLIGKHYQGLLYVMVMCHASRVNEGLLRNRSTSKLKSDWEHKATQLVRQSNRYEGDSQP